MSLAAAVPRSGSFEEDSLAFRTEIGAGVENRVECYVITRIDEKYKVSHDCLYYLLFIEEDGEEFEGKEAKTMGWVSRWK